MDAASRYIHKILLRDVPGDGVLSRYTSPSILQWESALGTLLLGMKVSKLIGDAAQAVDVEMAGYLARRDAAAGHSLPVSDSNALPIKHPSISGHIRPTLKMADRRTHAHMHAHAHTHAHVHGHAHL